MIKIIIKNLFLIPFLFFTISSCDMFEIDNYDGPNASLHGGIRDVQTGELVETDIRNGSRLQLYEYGWASEGSPLTKVVKQNGEYRDDMMFAGEYRIDFNSCNFYPFEVEKIIVKKGDNHHNFDVTPYIRVKGVNIRKEDNEIVATFNLQAGKPEVRLSNVQLYMHTDIYVGDQATSFTIDGSGFRQTFTPAIVIDESVTYTLKIDLSNNKNKPHFKYKRNYYFRVGAMASVSGVGTIRRNYAPYTIINFSVPQD